MVPITDCYSIQYDHYTKSIQHTLPGILFYQVSQNCQETELLTFTFNSLSITYADEIEGILHVNRISEDPLNTKTHNIINLLD